MGMAQCPALLRAHGTTRRCGLAPNHGGGCDFGEETTARRSEVACAHEPMRHSLLAVHEEGGVGCLDCKCSRSRAMATRAACGHGIEDEQLESVTIPFMDAKVRYEELETAVRGAREALTRKRRQHYDLTLEIERDDVDLRQKQINALRFKEDNNL